MLCHTMNNSLTQEPQNDKSITKSLEEFLLTFISSVLKAYYLQKKGISAVEIFQYLFFLRERSFKLHKC